MQLEDLVRVFGGRIRELGDRRWLDTHVGGLRTFIVCRAANGSGITFDLAVFTPHTRELDPFFSRDEGPEWRLDGHRVVLHLREGFLFAGCRRGIEFDWQLAADIDWAADLLQHRGLPCHAPAAVRCSAA